MYRAVISPNNVVICIGLDEGQSGQYLDQGMWCDFTFDAIPSLTEDLEALRTPIGTPMMFKVIDNQVVLRTLAEIQESPNA